MADATNFKSSSDCREILFQQPTPKDDISEPKDIGNSTMLGDE
jgi:hypothetical protein